MSKSYQKPNSTVTGMDLYNLTDLPPIQIAIMRTIMRNPKIEQEALFAKIRETMRELPPTDKQIKAALNSMVEKT